jgi:glycogen operon protein
VNELRDRQSRNILATLLLSQGTPMLLAGDELRNSQHGNNNAYCQDNELSWLDWEVDERAGVLREFTKRLLRLRAEHPVFRRSAFLTGEARQGSGAPDVWWFRPDGRKMTRRDWNDGLHALGMFLNGGEITTPGPHGEEIEDDSFVVLFNSDHEDQTFMLPRRRFGAQWALELSTADPAAEPASFGARTEVEVVARSIVILKRVT